MRYRRLGGTGLIVSELCLGTMTFGNGEGRFRPVAGVDQAGADALVERSLAAGINFLDTADSYSSGESEQILGRSLKTIGVKRSNVIIATKVSSDVGTGPNDRGSSRGHIMDSVAGSLDRLGVDHIDLYQIHHLDPLTPEEETLRALDDLVSQRLVRYIGCSNWPAWQIAKALGISAHHGWAKFDTVQAYYSIAERDLEREIVPKMADQKFGLLAWSPLAGGLLSGKFDAKAKPAEGRRTEMDFPIVVKERAWACIEAMRGIARKHTTSVARVALAWILSKGFVTSIIIGAKTIEQLNDNLGASGLDLSAAELASLDAISELPPEYPGWMAYRGISRRNVLERDPEARCASGYS